MCEPDYYPTPEDFGLDRIAPERVDAELERRRLSEMPLASLPAMFFGALLTAVVGGVIGLLPGLSLASLTREAWPAIALPAVGAVVVAASGLQHVRKRGKIAADAIRMGTFATDAEIESVERLRIAQSAWGDRSWPEWTAKSGHQFERDFGAALRAAGWDVTVTQASSDDGIDIIGRDQRGRAVAIQCKWWSAPCGVVPIRELVGVISTLDTETCGIVVCKSGFTRQAVKFAAKAGVILWEKEQVRAILEQADKRRGAHRGRRSPK